MAPLHVATLAVQRELPKYEIIILFINICCFNRRKLNKGPLLYIHLNLSIALLVMLVIFVTTVELAHPVMV